MSTPDFAWSENFQVDIQFGFLNRDVLAPGRYHPQVVLNQTGRTVEHALVEELHRAERFTFSVAFVSAAAIAQLKQHFRAFRGRGTIITSDFLGFNEPRAFAELLKLSERFGIEVRRHTAKGFHPKGYVFEHDRTITAMVGSSNLTSSALSRNYEWNLKVSAAIGSDLSDQIRAVVEGQMVESRTLTREWIDEYADNFLGAPRVARVDDDSLTDLRKADKVTPNSMQREALLALDFARAEGATRAIVISATGTGKTMLSALDVREVNPQRLLFLAHREQILDKTISEYRRALGGSAYDYGLLAGGSRELDRRYVFATVQTLSQDSVLAGVSPDAFDYVIIDEAHRAGAPTYQRVIDYLNPRFLLGMTATPERTDGFNVFELFHYNVPYEIRLGKALEAEMLCPFHYYGIADFTDDSDDESCEDRPLGVLISPDRVHHLLDAMDLYGQADVPPCGLIFCSRVEEARGISDALNGRTLNGRHLRTVALSGSDSIEARESSVAALEKGELDYILTVDVFNEGVDIPRVNQVIMLRQTQSAIVFVQQLGRGLRQAENKDYLVVIDFIGNYANNFLIPIALFGDESLNRESLRERLSETTEAGALPGLSSVSFDEISRERILKSISAAQLDSMSNLRNALIAMRNRVGGVPKLWDFYRFESVDPVLLATKNRKHYPALVQSLLREPCNLNATQSRVLALMSNEVLPAKRLHEFILFELLLKEDWVSSQQVADALASASLTCDATAIQSAVDTFSLEGYVQGDVNRYEHGIVEKRGEQVRLTPEFRKAFEGSAELQEQIEDLLKTGKQLTLDRYRTREAFTPGMQYSRRDAARILGWPRKAASTIYGVKTDEALGVCAVFVTLHKSDEVAASTAYQDRLIDTSNMQWFTKSNRTLASADVRGIVSGEVVVHVFVKKDDAEGADHYYLGQATAHEAIETTMADDDGGVLPVVTMVLKFKEPIKQGLFDYFQPLAGREN